MGKKIKIYLNTIQYDADLFYIEDSIDSKGKEYHLFYLKPESTHDYYVTDYIYYGKPIQILKCEEFNDKNFNILKYDILTKKKYKEKKIIKKKKNCFS